MSSVAPSVALEVASKSQRCITEWEEKTDAPSDGFSEGSAIEEEATCATSTEGSRSLMELLPEGLVDLDDDDDDGFMMEPYVASAGSLVDIDAEEGSRRGKEILAMLQEHRDLPAESPVEPPQPSAVPHPPNIVEGQWSRQAKSRAMKMRSMPLSRAADLFVPVAASAAPQPEAANDAESTMWTQAVWEAATLAFGEIVQDVEGSVQDGFSVRLVATGEGRDPAKELELLGQALWHQVGKDVWRIQPTVIPRRAWLTMDICRRPTCSVEAQCWEFVEHGVCPRGQLCRWQHPVPITYTFDVELL